MYRYSGNDQEKYNDEIERFSIGATFFAKPNSILYVRLLCWKISIDSTTNAKEDAEYGDKRAK